MKNAVDMEADSTVCTYFFDGNDEIFPPVAGGTVAFPNGKRIDRLGSSASRKNTCTFGLRSYRTSTIHIVDVGNGGEHWRFISPVWVMAA